jgi:hypothetical protein
MKAKVKNSIGVLFLMVLLFSIQGVKAADTSVGEAGAVSQTMPTDQQGIRFFKEREAIALRSSPRYKSLRQHFCLLPLPGDRVHVLDRTHGQQGEIGLLQVYQKVFQENDDFNFDDYFQSIQEEYCLTSLFNKSGERAKLEKLFEKALAIKKEGLGALCLHLSCQAIKAKECFDLFNNDDTRHYGMSTLRWLAYLPTGEPSQGLPLQAISSLDNGKVLLIFNRRSKKDLPDCRKVKMTLDEWEDISSIYGMIGPLELLSYWIFKGVTYISSEQDTMRAQYICSLIEGRIPVTVTLVSLVASLGGLLYFGARKAKREDNKEDTDDNKDDSKKVENESPDLIPAALHAGSDAGSSPIEEDPARTILFLFSLLMMVGILYAYRSRGAGFALLV